MLSNSVIGDSSRAVRYFFGQDNYYTKDSDAAKERSAWWGKGAAALNLEGCVDPKVFSELLKGKLPTGEQLGVKVGDEIKHRSGFDLTFSVPKSVSIAALLGNDDRILEAVQRASDKALGLVERACAQSRITKAGKTVYENTHNLVAAKFLHDLSREGDPQLHVHCVVMNMTQRSDGKWRSLASQLGDYRTDVSTEINGFIERVRHNAHYFGQAFDTELAFELKKLGYHIVKPDSAQQNRSFEIEGISQKSIDLYSRRRRQIETYMKDFGYSGAKAASVAALKTRQPKKNINHATIESLWRQMAEGKGIDAFGEAKECAAKAISRQAASYTVPQTIEKTDQVLGEVSQETQPSLPEGELSLPEEPQKVLEKSRISLQAVDHTEMNLPEESQKDWEGTHKDSFSAVQYAVRQLADTQIVLKETAIANAALKQGLGENVTLDAVFKAIEDLRQTGDLIALERADGKGAQWGDRIFTTKRQLEYERAVLTFAQAQTCDGAPLLNSQKIEAYLNASELSTEQAKALRTLFGHSHQVGILDGPAGTGKTQLLKSMLSLARAGGCHTVVLTPGKAQNETLKAFLTKNSTLRDWLGSLLREDHYTTVSGFLHAPSRYVNAGSLIKRKALVFIDDAHLLSSRQWHDLSGLAQSAALRIIALGDQQSMQTFQAGSPYGQMLKNGAVCASLTKNYRTQDKTLQAALDDSLNRNIDKAFEKISGRIFDVKDKEERLSLMADRYAQLSEPERAQTLLLMPSQAQCGELNTVVRQTLKQKGALGKDSLLASILAPQRLAEGDYGRAKSYAKGQWIRFNEYCQSLKIRKGDYLKVTDVLSKHNAVWLENEKGKPVVWHPQKACGRAGSVEVFESRLCELAVGETLTWRRNDKKLGFYNGERLRIVNMKTDQLTLQRDNHKTQKLSLASLASRHFDYGYAATPYQLPSKPPKNILAYQSSVSRQSHQRLFYKTLGQAKDNVWIYTEDKAVLLKNIQRCTGDKLTAIEVLLGKDALDAITEIKLLEKAVLEAMSALKGVSQAVFKEKTPAEAAKDAVGYAIAHLAEREAAFEHKEVMKAALHYALGKANVAGLEQAVKEAESKGDLIKGLYSQDGTRWTTLEAIEMEREVLRLAGRDKACAPLAAQETLEAYLKAVNPKAEHGNAMRAMLLHTAPVLAIEGYAGVGKTTLLKHIEPLLTQENYELRCLAPTHSAVKELSARGLKAQTLESFLGEHRGFLNALDKNDTSQAPAKSPSLILAVDESSMVSNRRMRDFLRIAEALEARSWIMGDPKQYPAIESGKPARLLDRAGVKTLSLTDIERQKEPTLLAAVNASYQEDFAKAFRLLEKNIVEIGLEAVGKLSKKTESPEKKIDNGEKRLTAMAEAYGQLSPAERAQTLMMTLGNKDRRLANDCVRAELLKQGGLSGKAMTTVILSSKDMTSVEKSRAENYRAGDMLRFGRAYQPLGIEQNAYLTVKDIYADRNLLTLKTLKGQEVAFKLQGKRSFIEVYQAEERTLQTGDYIRWTRSDKEAGFLSPEVLRVEKIVSDNIALQPVKVSSEGWQAQGSPLLITPQNCRHQHWDYAYVMTGYSAQGRTVKNVLLNAESYRKKLTNQASFLVGLTRAVEKITLYTDDKEKLLQKIKSTVIEKTSALETTGELKAAAKKDKEKPVIKELSPAEIQRAEEERRWKEFLFKQAAVEKQLEREAKAAAAEKQTVKSAFLEKGEIVKARDFAVQQSRAEASVQEREKAAEKEKPIGNIKTSIEKSRTLPGQDFPVKPVQIKPLAQKPVSRRLDAERITQALQENIEAVVEKLLGEPKEKKAQQYRYGSRHGSLIVTLKGDKQGLWHDFQTGEGGSLLHLIARQNGLNIKTEFHKVLAEGARMTGSPEAFVEISYPKKKTARTSVSAAVPLTDAQKKSLKYAQKLARESLPVKGTIAEQYLKRHRGIALEHFPDSIRYHPAIYSRLNGSIYPALLAVAKDNAGKVNAVQAIYLDEATGQKAQASVKKQTWGLPSAGGSVNLGDSKAALVFLAEGPETGLSILAAIKNVQVKVTLGKSNFKNIRLSTDQKDIVLCLDNDGHLETEKKTLANIAEKLKSEDRTLWVVMPEQAHKDYNDILKEQGVEAVRHNIENAVKLNDFIQGNESGLTLKTARLDKGISLQSALLDIPSIEVSQRLKKEAVTSAYLSDALKNDIAQAIHKVADRFNAQEAALNQMPSNALAIEKDFVQKDTGKALPMAQYANLAQNNKATEKIREWDKEIELES